MVTDPLVLFIKFNNTCACVTIGAGKRVVTVIDCIQRETVGPHHCACAISGITP